MVDLVVAPVVIVLCGAPCSGKSTFAARLRPLGYEIVSQDELGDRSYDALAQLLRWRRNVVLDGCNSTSRQRQEWLGIVMSNASDRATVIAVQLLIPIDLCKHRAHERHYHNALPPHLCNRAIDSFVRDWEGVHVAEGFNMVLTAHNDFDCEGLLSRIANLNTMHQGQRTCSTYKNDLSWQHGMQTNTQFLHAWAGEPRSRDWDNRRDDGASMAQRGWDDCHARPSSRHMQHNRHHPHEEEQIVYQPRQRPQNTQRPGSRSPLPQQTTSQDAHTVELEPNQSKHQQTTSPPPRSPRKWQRHKTSPSHSHDSSKRDGQNGHNGTVQRDAAELQPGDMPAQGSTQVQQPWRSAFLDLEPPDDRIILLFDLNGTLTTHTSRRKSAGRNRLRPRTAELVRLMQRFRVGIFTSSTIRTVTSVRQMLENAAGLPFLDPRLILFREHTAPAPQAHVAQGGDPWDTIKPLHRWFANLHRVLLFDDDAYKAVPGEEANMVLVPCWADEDPADRLLVHLVDTVLQVLGSLGPSEDVRLHSEHITQLLAAAVVGPGAVTQNNPEEIDIGDA